MGALNEFLQTKGIYTLVMILFFLGVYGMVLSKTQICPFGSFAENLAAV